MLWKSYSSSAQTFLLTPRSSSSKAVHLLFHFNRILERRQKKDSASLESRKWFVCQVAICLYEMYPREYLIKWATSWQNQQNDMNAQQRLWSDWLNFDTTFKFADSHDNLNKPSQGKTYLCHMKRSDWSAPLSFAAHVV